MKIWIIAIVLLTGSLTAAAQQDFSLYLQTENRQPFYVKLNQNIYSSTESGYVIIPKLGDSTYQILVGFPKNLFGEQSFKVPINRKDGGYLLKNFGDRGWGLFNLQTMAVVMNSNPPEKKSPELTGIRKTDNFSILLANVVNDTAVLYAGVRPKPAEPVAKKETVKKQDMPAIKDTVKQEPVVAVTEPKQTEPTTKDTATIIAKTATPRPPLKDTAAGARPPLKDTAATAGRPATTTPAKDTAINISKVPEEVVMKEKKEPVKTSVNRVAELLTDTSYIAVYIDEAQGLSDTIRVSIPFAGTRAALYDTTTRKQRELEVVRIDSPKTEPLYRTDSVATDTTRRAEPLYRTETPKTDTTAAAPKKEPLFRTDSAKEKSADTTATAIKTAAPPKANCIAVASENEIDKLRVKMLAVTSDNGKIDAAKKLLSERCVTTKQVKSLSELFHSNEARLKWIETTMTHISDPAMLSSLEWLLTDEASRSRFRTLIRK